MRKRLLPPRVTCKKCGVTLQHHIETYDSAIVEQTKEGSRLVSVKYRSVVRCRNIGCGKVTIISGEIPVGQEEKQNA